MAADADRLAAVSAALRREGADLSMYGGFLLNTLSEALPEHLVEVTRRGALLGRIRGAAPAVTAVRVRLGERGWSLRRDRVGAAPHAAVEHVSGGVVLSRSEVSLDRWVRGLVEALGAAADRDAAVAESLGRLTLPRGRGL